MTPRTRAHSRKLREKLSLSDSTGLPKPAEVTTASDGSAKALRIRRRIGLWLAAGATVASLIVGVISIIPILSRDASGVGTFEATARVIAGDFFVLPADLLADFPIGSADGCDAAQRNWLESRANPVPRTVLIEVRNVAAEGPMLSVGEVRGEGELTKPATASVIVECSPWDQAGSGKSALLDLSGESVAAFDNSLAGENAGGLPDSPVAYNLAPGETAQFSLTLFSSLDFSGELVATVSSGRERVGVPIAIEGIESLRASGTIGSGSSYVTVLSGSLSCVRPGLRAAEPVFEEAAACVAGGNNSEAG